MFLYHVTVVPLVLVTSFIAAESNVSNLLFSLSDHERISLLHALRCKQIRTFVICTLAVTLEDRWNKLS